MKLNRDAWCASSLADEDIIRIILDGTVINQDPHRHEGHEDLGSVPLIIPDPRYVSIPSILKGAQEVRRNWALNLEARMSGHS